MSHRAFVYLSTRLLVYFVIFGCARHSPNKFGSALACTKISSFTCLLVYNLHNEIGLVGFERTDAGKVE